MSEQSLESLRRPIHVLNTEVARKIAAGEVIDRPNAIVRELMDNAVDSGASSITVEIEGGGIDKIRVIDNGCGLSQKDLLQCARPHATSKITTETDLLHLTTLGFRGEALASIAAVSRLSITSLSHRMRASVSEDHIIEPVQPINGTIVQSEALFENFPARRVFLKRPASEMMMCKNTFIEKVLPKPNIAFRLNVDNEMKLNLQANQTLAQRFVQALSITENVQLFYEIEGKGSNFSFKLIIGEPSVTRSDKKLIFIYVNGRKITEYSLMQAIEYGGQGFFPNGLHPVAALFVEMNPEAVDFNIHPAKKEARFQDISELHHAVSSSVRNFFHQYTIKAVISTEQEIAKTKELFEDGMSNSQINEYREKQLIQAEKNQQADFRSRFFSPSNAFSSSSFSKKQEPQAIKEYSISHQSPEQLATAALEASDSSKGFKYIGTCLGVFLIAEKNDTLYLIDQHAAHERILFNKIMESQGKRQELLVPYTIETSSNSEDEYLKTISQKLEEIGFTNKYCENGKWEITSIPERWKGTEAELSKALLSKRCTPEEIQSELFAMTACKSAIKDGYILDSTTAADLAKEALELPDPHCPHGRPIFTAITRTQLFDLVKRT